MKKLFFILFALGMIVIYSCSKDGAVGPSGASGAKGTDGNANVYYSSWETLPLAWGDTLLDGTNFKYNYQIAPILTKNMIDSGAVLVYINWLSGGIYPLPYTSYAGGNTNTFNFFLSVGKINYTRFAIDNTVIGVSSIMQYRYVVIPGGIHTSKTATNTDYKYICRKYNIPE